MFWWVRVRNRRRAIALLGSAVTVGSVIVAMAWNEPDAEGPPDVIVVTLDTTRLDDLGVYGGEARTPSLRTLRRDALLFHGAHSNAYGTTPSHATLFTSMYARDHGVYDNKSTLPPVAVTLAEALAFRGYRTGAFVSAVPLQSELGLDQGFQRYDDRFDGHDRNADKTTERAIEWMRNVNDSASPTMLWVHYYDPHQPYMPPAGFARAHGVEPGPRARVETASGHEATVRFDQGVEPDPYLRQPALLGAVDRQARARYRGEIDFMDHHLGRLFDALRRMEKYEGAVVVVIADHGEHFLRPHAPLAFDHSMSLHRDVSGIPLLMKLPGAELGGSEHDFLLGNVDVAPTIMELAGFDPPGSWRGRSFATALRQSGNLPRSELVIEGAHRHMVSVRSTRWMYQELLEEARGRADIYERSVYEAGGAPYVLYDRASDPEEAHDVYASPGPEGRRALQRLRHALRRFEARRPRRASAQLEDEAFLEKLRALGYTQ